MKAKILVGLGAAALAATAFVAPPTAYACGGFFCNRQAIDQSGENILFAYNADGTVTTVVQILYQGPSEEFAWILPVPAEPEVDVGTDALFTQLGFATQPRFQTRSEILGECRQEPACYDYYGRFDDSDGVASGPPMAGADAGAAEEPGVEVRLRANIGPYDVAVLAAGDVTALRQWLTDNGYLIPDEASAELDHYVALDHFFVALKLQKNRSTGEIQPIVLRSENNEPCIPIRLTRIATVPDMPVTAYFLGDQRTRPLNYMLVEPDLEDFGLWTGATSYSQAVTDAVDDAGGHAFVTDYAGDTPSSVQLELDPIEDLRTIGDPATFLSMLQSRGFTGDSQLLGILTVHIPPPTDWDPQTFYNCLVQGWCGPEVDAYVATLAFDPSLLVDTLNEAIVHPRAEAQSLVDAHPHLTRLFTTLSADEMTEDPMFMRSSELDREYSNVHEAVIQTHCSQDYFYWTAPQTLVLPSGSTQTLREGVPYTGSDEAYCEDRYEGDFRPGMPIDRLREVSRERELSPGGGGALCAATPGSTGGLGAALVGVLGLIALGWRRRRRAR